MPVIDSLTFNVRDFVKETTQTSGTGTYQLDGVSPAGEGLQSFLTAVGDGQKTLYVVKRAGTWEKGIGTVSAGSPVTLSRDKILGTSADDTEDADPIDWPTNDPKDIWIGSPADLLNLILDPQRIVDLEDRFTEFHGQLAAFSGTKMLFVQAAAPIGWAIDATRHDRMVRIIDGTTDGAVGGTNGGTWTVSGLTADGHSLTTAELAEHDHPSNTGGTVDNITTGGTGPSARGTSSNSTGDRGDGDPHTHTVSSTGNWRPLYQNALVCTAQTWLFPA